MSVPDAPRPDAAHPGFRGPWCWSLTLLGGLLLGTVLSYVLPAGNSASGPVIPIWLVAPFALLLGSIALMPFVNPRFWHDHFPDFAFFLGGIVVAYYLLAFGRAGGAPSPAYGPAKMLHAAREYYSFIALVGGLFVVSGGILVEVRGRGGPLANAGLLAFGAVLANLVGTTGASMLLIRPYMRLNGARLRPLHVVFFIFIVSNCAGCLTPIGDPPLYLGFLKGVPFFWTLANLWDDWLLVTAMLILAAWITDRWHDRRTAGAELHERQPAGVSVRGGAGIVCLALMIGGVFIDPIFGPAVEQLTGIHGLPIGATFQIIVAAGAYRLAPREILRANDFSFFPVREVGLLFVGIFATMAPALGYLAAHGSGLHLDSPTAFYFATGSLSAVLDNAPTYLAFLQVSFGDTEINAATIAARNATPTGFAELRAVSTGAVFFGAMTYIGNGPNFMVRSIAQSAGVKMPSFPGYVLWAIVILLPILALHWLLFIR